MAFGRDEVQAAVERYHELRRRIDDGLEPDGFGALADFYTDDAVYVDAAWGRIEGKEAIARGSCDSMVGLGDWKFPIEFTAIEGERRGGQVDPDHPRFEARRHARTPSRPTPGCAMPATESSPTRRTPTTWSTCSRTWRPAGGSPPSP